MKTTEQTTEKQMYLYPTIQLIKLDNEISLVLESNPPLGPGEAASLVPEYMKTNPFRDNLG